MSEQIIEIRRIDSKRFAFFAFIAGTLACSLYCMWFNLFGLPPGTPGTELTFNRLIETLTAGFTLFTLVGAFAGLWAALFAGLFCAIYRLIVFFAGGIKITIQVHEDVPKKQT